MLTITSALRCTALYVVLPVLRSGKTNTLARPATGLSGALLRRDRGDRRGVVLQRAVDEQVGIALAHEPRSPRSTLSTSAPAPDVPVLKLIIATRGSMPNAAGGGGALQGDVGELLGVGVGVDRTVAVDHHLVGQAHEEDRRHQPGAGGGAEQLQRRPERGRGGVHGAGDQAVDLVEPQHHGAERDRCRRAGCGRCRASCPCADGPPRARRRTARATSAGSTTSRPGGQGETERLGLGGHLVGWAPSSTHRAMPISWQVTAARMRARLGALGQHDPPVGLAGLGREPAPERRRAQPRARGRASAASASQSGSSASATAFITSPARSASSTGTSGSMSCTVVAVS